MTIVSNFERFSFFPTAYLCFSSPISAIKRNGKSKTKQSEYEGEALLFVFVASLVVNKCFLCISLEKIRVGRDYQAVCPPLIPDPDRKPETVADRALLVWSPTKEIADKSCKW